MTESLHFPLQPLLVMWHWWGVCVCACKSVCMCVSVYKRGHAIRNRTVTDMEIYPAWEMTHPAQKHVGHSIWRSWALFTMRWLFSVNPINLIPLIWSQALVVTKVSVVVQNFLCEVLLIYDSSKRVRLPFGAFFSSGKFTWQIEHPRVYMMNSSQERKLRRQLDGSLVFSSWFNQAAPDLGHLFVQGFPLTLVATL